MLMLTCYAFHSPRPRTAGAANNPFRDHPKILETLTKLRANNPNLAGYGTPAGYGKYPAVAREVGWPTDNQDIKNFFNTARR